MNSVFFRGAACRERTVSGLFVDHQTPEYPQTLGSSVGKRKNLIRSAGSMSLNDVFGRSVETMLASATSTGRCDVMEMATESFSGLRGVSVVSQRAVQKHLSSSAAAPLGKTRRFRPRSGGHG